MGYNSFILDKPVQDFLLPMNIITISLPKHTMRISISKRRRKGPSASFFPSLRTLAAMRSGSKFSRVFRHFAQRANLKGFFGLGLATVSIFSGFITPVGAFSAPIETEINTVSAPTATTSTEISMQYPLEKIKLNQGYNYFHWGIDLAGEFGTTVRPIKKGRIAQVNYSKFTYGNSVLVDHEQDMQSFYAHLSKIYVFEGQEIDTKGTIGEIGSTGNSTGPHLHLEIYKDGRPVNPLGVLVE